jgi:hypothetical protein
VRYSVVQVIAWRKVLICVDPNFEPSSILQNPWEARCILSEQEPSSILNLITSYEGKLQFAWGQQRLHLPERLPGFVRWRSCCVLHQETRHRIACTQPNEKYYRLGVSKDKSQSIAYAAAYFADTSPELVQDLTSRPVGECMTLQTLVF